MIARPTVCHRPINTQYASIAGPSCVSPNTHDPTAVAGSNSDAAKSGANLEERPEQPTAAADASNGMVSIAAGGAVGLVVLVALLGLLMFKRRSGASAANKVSPPLRQL